MTFEEFYGDNYARNDPVFKMHCESVWNAAINSAAYAVEGSEHSDDDSGHAASCSAMIAVEKLRCI